MPVQEMSDIEFQRHALAILKRELGIEGFARFLRLYRSSHGDYTKERYETLGNPTIRDIVEQVRGGAKPESK